MQVYGMSVHALPEMQPDEANGHRLIPLGIEQRSGPHPARTLFRWTERSAVLRVRGACSVVVARGDEHHRLRVTAPYQVDEAELLHPVLGFAGGIVAWWTGRHAYHGASVVMNSRAVLLLAPPGGGKSTVAAMLATRGHPILTEDLAVIADGDVLAGPRVCDLRAASAAALGIGEPLRDMPLRRDRWRMALGTAPASAPLAGLIALTWGPTGIRRLTTAERLGALAKHRALGLTPSTEDGLLDLLALPALEVARPQSYGTVDGDLGAIEGALHSLTG